MIYIFDVYDSAEDYKSAICGEDYDCINLSIEGEEKAQETLKMLLDAGKTVVATASDAPF